MPRPTWPQAADGRAARILAERLEEAAAARGLDPAPLHAPEAHDAIAAIGGNSPYLAALAEREAASFLDLLRHGPDRVARGALATLQAEGATAASTAELAAVLRRAKRLVALAAAFGDLGGIWPLERVTAVLSTLADRTIALATAHLLRVHDLPRRGVVVLAMGKLGAHELNYSSDVDLFLLHDLPDAAPGTLARLARDLAALMETRDADGYVFRVDLRLRPDPSATSPVVGWRAAIAYYESTALTWERAAMTKARAVAGDLALGRRFLDRIAPFIWRRHLDFAAIADMRAIKRRIDRHHAGGPDGGALLGRDLKLGRGGIREIEFTAQTVQLVWGGRSPSLREPGTVAALEALAEAGHLDRADAGALAAAYRLLRTAEHRLQMVADRQTHRLPADAAGFARFATFMGHADPAELTAALAEACTRVHAIFDATLADPADRAAPALDAPTFERLGFRRPNDAARIAAAWTATPPRALRAERARLLLPALLGELLPAIGRLPDPDAALVRFDRLLERLPAGVQTFSLLAGNPALLDRLAVLLGAAPALADHLAAVPSALEGLLAPGTTPEAAPARTLARELAGRPGGETVEVAIDTARRFVRGREFRISLAELDGAIDPDRAGRARTALACATISVLLERVRREHAVRHGEIEGGEAVVVALGKCGSREMVAGSDLDLMLLYDHAPDAAASTGPRALAPAAYYARLTQSLIGALTAPGAEGPLYPVDMRLRPSGRAGPVAVSLAAFRTYHATAAWTWERMAMTRARVVAGPPALAEAVRVAIAASLDGAHPRAETIADVVDMRRRLAAEHRAAGPWDVKWRAGGLLEVEFIAAALQLGAWVPAAARTPAVGESFGRLARAGLLGASDARRLREAARFWRRLQSALRLLEGARTPRPALPDAMGQALAQAMGLDLASLEEAVEARAAIVRAAFTRYLGAP